MPAIAKRRASRFVWFARAVARSALRAAGVRTGTFYLMLFIVAGIVFGGSNATRASDVTAAAHATRWLWGVLWLGWWVLTTPVAHTVLELPSTDVLRTLPLPRRYFLTVHTLLLLVAELPWTLLWARGEGVGPAIAATLGVMAGHALIVARARPWPAALALGGLGLAVALHAAWWILALVALCAGAVGLPSAIDDAPARALSRVHRRTVGGPAPLALALAYGAMLRRGSTATLIRGVLAVSVGAGMAALVIRNNAVIRPASVLTATLGLGVPVLLLAAGSVAIPVALAERRDRWMLDAVGVGGATRVFAAVAPPALWCMALGVYHGALVAAVIPGGFAGGLMSGLVGGACGGGLGVLAAVAARWAARGGQANAERLVLVLVPLLILVEIAVGYLGSWALGPIWIAALLLGLRSTEQAAALEQPVRGRPALDHLERSE